MLAERNSLAAVHRIEGIKEEYHWDWLRKASNHFEKIETLLLATYPLMRINLMPLVTKGKKRTIRRI
jgi:hypothetical protein